MNMSSMQGPVSEEGHLPCFHVHQKFSLLLNQYRVIAPAADSGQDDRLIAFAEQKRLKIKEELLFFTDESKEIPLFSCKSRRMIDAWDEMDIFDAAGAQLAVLSRAALKSMLRSTWNLHYSGVKTTGQERNLAIAVIRRFTNVPFLPYHFDFTDDLTGQTVLTVDRQMSLRDRYTVTVPDARLDFRVAAAMAVVLDALQGR